MRPDELTRRGAAACLMVLIAVLGSDHAMAQWDQAVPGKDLVEPWTRAQAVVRSLADLSAASVEPGKRSRLDRTLSELDAQLSALQAQEEAVAIGIVSNPGFAYDAPLRSSEMAVQVSEIEQSFDSLIGELMLRERSDVRAAQQSLAALRLLLYEKNRLERDVLRALGSGSKHEIQALAARWWAAAESVEGVRDVISAVRRPLRALPGNEPGN